MIGVASKKIRRIPTLEITRAAEDNINNLAKRLEIRDARDLITRSILALEALVEFAGADADRVTIQKKDSTGKFTGKELTIKFK